MDEYDFGNMKLQDVAVTPDCQRLVGVGPLLRSPTGLQPSRSRVEQRIVGMCVVPFKVLCMLTYSIRLSVYNMETKQIEK